MATNVWRGDATAVAQVDTVQVTAYDAATTYKLTINGKIISTIAAGSANATATALAAAWNLSTVPEFAEVTASANTDTVTLTADTAGKPFTCTSSVAGGAGTIGAVTNATASAGPNDWSTAGNWSLAAVPVVTNDVVIENSSVSILYGLSQAGATLNSLTIASTFTGTIGLPRTNSGGYYEYRTAYLTVDATTVSIGVGSGSGSSRIKLNTGTVQTTVNVYNTSTGAESGLESLLWKGTHASNVLNVVKGSVGVAVFAGETATIATLRVGYLTQQTGDATVRCGSGTTLTTIEKSGGTLQIESNSTTVTQTAGDLTILGAATVTTLNLDGGNCYYRSTGTATTVNVSDGGAIDYRRDMRARTITNANLYSRGAIRDPHKTVTFTNGVDLVRCNLSDVTLDLGDHLTLTPSAI